MRGGARAGAGRPRGSGKYGEPTKAVRLPLSVIEQLPQLLDQQSPRTPLSEVYRPKRGAVLELPLYQMPVSAGFPSPADDYIEQRLDLNRHLIKNPAATFMARVSGDSMIGVGIHDGDMIIVDRSLEPRDGQIVIAVLNGELTVKRLRQDRQRLFLQAENPNYPDLEITDGSAFQIWGVVTNVIHAL
ncbi:LexA family protein [Synechococcus elongatus]|uniref:Translesion error-prone DNA polymerase V autoproteolytic subunit n=1 Tax=Synechococcus elongatus PCC 11802 TaxID=2283154 RepID=A0AAT9JTP3_SYNEL|nr:translesion error-prone DNA polymerase V autoproteolytic subunit [Synechococcus elongatus]QFZ92476.1 translesion error-prone DNA polymerase V autoproteolytic subunit [Synechococcus elongatus PCC 11802]